MKLIRVGDREKERPGVLLDDGTRLDVSSFGADYDESFFGSGGVESLRQWLPIVSASLPTLSASERLGPPICRPSKIVCIGLNFRDHALETQAQPPSEPVIFFKASTSVVGPNGSGKSNLIESLLFVFGKRAKRMRLNKLSELIHNSAEHPEVSHATVRVYFQDIIDDEDEPDYYEVVPGT